MPITVDRPIAMDDPDENRNNNQSNNDQMMTVRQVASRLNFQKTDTIHNLIATKQLRAYKIAGKWRVKREDLDDFIERSEWTGGDEAQH